MVTDNWNLSRWIFLLILIAKLSWTSPVCCKQPHWTLRISAVLCAALPSLQLKLYINTLFFTGVLPDPIYGQRIKLIKFEIYSADIPMFYYEVSNHSKRSDSCPINVVFCFSDRVCTYLWLFGIISFDLQRNFNAKVYLPCFFAITGRI